LSIFRDPNATLQCLESRIRIQWMRVPIQTPTSCFLFIFSNSLAHTIDVAPPRWAKVSLEHSFDKILAHRGNLQSPPLLSYHHYTIFLISTLISSTGCPLSSWHFATNVVDVLPPTNSYSKSTKLQRAPQLPTRLDKGTQK
jgi:hypothetical protein